MEQATNTVMAYGTFWALVPALVAIVLALVSKEVYSSLFVGVIVGGLLLCQGTGSGSGEPGDGCFKTSCRGTRTGSHRGGTGQVCRRSRLERPHERVPYHADPGGLPHDVRARGQAFE